MSLERDFAARHRVQNGVRYFSFCLIFTGFCAGHAAAQCSSVPTTFAQECTEIQGYLTSFNATLGSQWDGSRSPVSFNTNLLTADDNGGLQRLLNPNTLSGVERELDGLVRLGMQSVNISVGFPLLYEPFYQWNNDPQDYQTVLTFYQSVMSEARQRGLKVLIESSVVFPSTATDVPLSQYYATLSDANVTTGRAQVALTIAQQLQPDWLDLGSEPDTQSYLLGRPAEYTPTQYASLISSIVAELRNAGIKGTPLIGAGCGRLATGWERLRAGADPHRHRLLRYAPLFR